MKKLKKRSTWNTFFFYREAILTLYTVDNDCVVTYHQQNNDVLKIQEPVMIDILCELF